MSAPDRFLQNEDSPAAIQEAGHLVSSAATASLLAAAGGYLDAFTYIGHGHVFANAMTGNVVLLGVNCISGSWGTGLRHLPPIVAFLVGVFAAKAIHLLAAQRLLRFPYLSVLALEIAILAGLSILPASTADFWITTSIAFAASVQVQSFRKVGERSYNSTFTTGNLRILSEAVFDWLFAGRTPEIAAVIRDFAFICTSFFAGAVAGGFATPLFEKWGMLNRALWIDMLLLLVVVVRVWPTRQKT